MHCTLFLLLSLILAAAPVGAHTARHAAGTFCFSGAQQLWHGCVRTTQRQPTHTPTCYSCAERSTQHHDNTRTAHRSDNPANPCTTELSQRTRQHGMRVHTTTTRGSTGCQTQHPHKLMHGCTVQHTNNRPLSLCLWCDTTATHNAALLVCAGQDKKTLCTHPLID